jgi:hypothetical protein
MNGFAQAASAHLLRSVSGRALPEWRKIELYTNTSEALLFDPDASGPANHWNQAPVMGALSAFMLLDAHLECERPELAGLTARERFLAWRPDTRTRRLTAQVYRILKILRRGVSAPGARLASAERVFQVNYVETPFAFGLRVSFAGLELLSGFVALYLDFKRQPFPEAYVEAMLAAYYEDIVAELRYLSDEDGSVLHFRKRFAFNRHFRFQCCTARYALTAERLEIEIGERFADKREYPLDFFLMIEGEFHIIPCEALENGGLSREALAEWKARRPDPGEGLPEYHLRLKSEALSSGPMA